MILIAHKVCRNKSPIQPLVSLAIYSTGLKSSRALSLSLSDSTLIPIYPEPPEAQTEPPKTQTLFKTCSPPGKRSRKIFIFCPDWDLSKNLHPALTQTLMEPGPFLNPYPQDPQPTLVPLTYPVPRPAWWPHRRRWHLSQGPHSRCSVALRSLAGCLPTHLEWAKSFFNIDYDHIQAHKWATE